LKDVILSGLSQILQDFDKVAEMIISEIEIATNKNDESGYKAATEFCVGKLLSYSPVGEDGIFPHEIIRNYFEKSFVKDEIDEFVVGKYNQRGVHALSGGMNEKKISDDYYEDATAYSVLI